jgi:hypothetical protein
VIAAACPIPSFPIPCSLSSKPMIDLPPDYIDPEHKGRDLELLEVFYKACRSEGGTADEIHLRGLKAVLALAQPEPRAGSSNGLAQEHLARLMRDALGVETNHNAYICAAGKILARREFTDYVVSNATHAPLAQPEPEGPTTEQIMDLADDCDFESQEISGFDGGTAFRDHGWECTDAQLMAFAAALLTRYARPAIQPVPVAERPWEREGWRDAEGICWWFHKATPDTNAGWIPATHEDIELVGIEFFSHSLPHHALPVPGAEAGQ